VIRGGGGLSGPLPRAADSSVGEKEMTGPEIAARTGLTHGSVRETFAAACKLLREKLGETVQGIMAPRNLMKDALLGDRLQGRPTRKSKKTRDDIGGLSPQSTCALRRSNRRCSGSEAAQAIISFLRFPIN